MSTVREKGTKTTARLHKWVDKALKICVEDLAGPEDKELLQIVIARIIEVRELLDGREAVSPKG